MTQAQRDYRQAFVMSRHTTHHSMTWCGLQNLNIGDGLNDKSKNTG